MLLGLSQYFSHYSQGKHSHKQEGLKLLLHPEFHGSLKAKELKARSLFLYTIQLLNYLVSHSTVCQNYQIRCAMHRAMLKTGSLNIKGQYEKIIKSNKNNKKLKDTLRPIKNYKGFSEHEVIQMRHCQTGSGQEYSTDRSYEQIQIEKRRKQIKEIIDQLQIKASLAVCECMVLAFWFCKPTDIYRLGFLFAYLCRPGQHQIPISLMASRCLIILTQLIAFILKNLYYSMIWLLRSVKNKTLGSKWSHKH